MSVSVIGGQCGRRLHFDGANREVRCDVQVRKINRIAQYFKGMAKRGMRGMSEVRGCQNETGRLSGTVLNGGRT
jgi:hypothetical protein